MTRPHNNHRNPHRHHRETSQRKRQLWSSRSSKSQSRLLRWITWKSLTLQIKRKNSKRNKKSIKDATRLVLTSYLRNETQRRSIDFSLSSNQSYLSIFKSSWIQSIYRTYFYTSHISYTTLTLLACSVFHTRMSAFGCIWITIIQSTSERSFVGDKVEGHFQSQSCIIGVIVKVLLDDMCSFQLGFRAPTSKRRSNIQT